MMFADDRSIENLQQLFVEFKKYLKLQKEYTKLEITEKLSILLSALLYLPSLHSRESKTRSQASGTCSCSCSGNRKIGRAHV